MGSVSVSDDGLWSKIDEQEKIERRQFKKSVDLAEKITSNVLTPEQTSAYQIMYRIEELSKKLSENDFEYCNTPQRERSPSPPPLYDAKGKRTNTRELRYKKKLEDERHRLIDLALKLIPHYRAPEGYAKPTNFKDKFFIPVNEYTHINFVGLLLGPRGNTLKQLQQSTGCKIAIRGRGSVKEGKTVADLPKDAMNLAEPLHCVIIADSEEKMRKGVKACEAVVIKAVTSPEGQNDLKRGQLRELAELNGTLREDNRPCAICGLTGHIRFDCPQREVYADKIICQKCGRPGHVAQDCSVISRYNKVEQSEPLTNNNKRRAEAYSYNAEIYQDENPRAKKYKKADVQEVYRANSSVVYDVPAQELPPPSADYQNDAVSDNTSGVVFTESTHAPGFEHAPPGFLQAYGPPGMYENDESSESNTLPPPPAFDLAERGEEDLPPPPGI